MLFLIIAVSTSKPDKFTCDPIKSKFLLLFFELLLKLFFLLKDYKYFISSLFDFQDLLLHYLVGLNL